MAPISLKIISNEGAVTRKVKFDTKMTVREAHAIVKEKVIVPDPTKEHGLFLRSPDNERVGIWLENHRTLDYYMLRDGDSLEYICKFRILRVKLLDGSVKSMPVDEGKTVSELMVGICGRLNITNYDEYGLCPEEDEKTEEVKELPETGTLTRKRPKPQPKERDVTLEQLGKKLNTDDHVHWLDQHSTLRELGVGTSDTVILKRRLFYSDRNVDERDPVQLNLLYVQTRDAILDGKHLVTEDQAVEFAGIQCQIHFDDFQEDKHKPGFIENLKEFLPEPYCGSWGVERKVLRAHRKHVGLAPLEAKNLYIKTARDLPTYGVTFFLVKEKQKGKKKLVPRLLGINAGAILRMDENTKEILQQWPLTHVKSYHVGKSETFALNFGDYSDKEYCCKTQDAFRIRDILEGYIDIIRRRMLAPTHTDTGDSMAVCHDNVQSGQIQIIQHIQNQPSKLVKETFVGPTRIVPFEQGSSAQQGTQMMTMQQIIQTNQFNNQQRPLKGEIAQRGQMSTDCVRTLKRMNSCSVKTVTLLADPTEENISEAQELTKTMQDNLAVVEMGVKEVVKQQTIEESQQMLLNEMQDLNNYVNKLSYNIQPGHVNTLEARDAAERIVDLTTSMYCAQDIKTRRRSELLNRSKKSFIADEKMDASIRRGSFLSAAAHAHDGARHALTLLAQEYKGPVLDKSGVEQLESSLQDHLGKLNAALALYLTAHSDPNNIDYTAAIDSMNTIKELLPKLAREGQQLSSSKCVSDREELLRELRALFDHTRHLCDLTAADDHQKMQEASSKYADIADKLLFTFSRGRNYDKENEIIELARDAGDKTSLLLLSANELLSSAPTQSVQGVDRASVRCAGAARDLLACAQLVAPAICEPHCQSALTAATSGLSSAVHALASSLRPLDERGELLHTREMDVHTALEKLQDAYLNMNDESSAPLAERQRLKFVHSLSAARDHLRDIPATWGTSGESVGVPHGGVQNPALPELKAAAARRRLAQQLALLNAAVATLARATLDPENPDYMTAESALNTIAELMPTIAHDAEVLSATQEAGASDVTRDYIQALCDDTRRMLDNLHSLQDVGPAAAKYSASCKKLLFLVSPASDQEKEKKLNELASAACDSSAAFLAETHSLREQLDGATAEDLSERAERAEQAARALLTVTQVTAPSIKDASCSSALSSALQQLQSCSEQLYRYCLQHLTAHSHTEEINNYYTQLHDNIRKMADIAQIELSKHPDMLSPSESGIPAALKEKRRLQFVNSLPAARERLDAAEQYMKEPLPCVMLKGEDASVLASQLADRLAILNATVATLARATADRERPDFESAEKAVDTLTQLMPDFVQETCVLGATKSGDTQNNMLQYLQQLCDSSRNLCRNDLQTENVKEAATKFSDASGKLHYLLSPGAKQDKEKQIIDLSSDACVRASELLSKVQALTQRLPAEEGEELDKRGAKTADTAQALLTTAQVTAPTIASPHCSESLVSVAEQLRSSAKDLTNLCQPHLKPGHQEQLELQQSQGQLEDSLNDLVLACKEASRRKPPPPPQSDKQRAHLMRSVSGAKSCFDDVQQQLQQPVVCALMREQDATDLQHQLSERLSQLNAAIAALTAATADRSHPDYASAQRAVDRITTLIPQLVKDSRTLSGTKAGDAQQDMLQQVQQLCDASRAMCDSVGEPQALNTAAAKFSDASGKFMFTISPSKENSKEKQIIDLSSDACVRASELLSKVQALTQRLPAEEGEELDKRGAKTADTAQALLTTAQVTAPTIASPHCSESLVSVAEQLRSSAKDLTNLCQPHLKPGHQEQLELQQSQGQLEDSLNDLVLACKEASRRKPPPPPQSDKQRAHLMRSVSGAKSCFDDVQQQLQQPVVCALMREQDATDLQHQLSERLSQLNAAIAALTAATADRSHPDYASAQRAVDRITTLIPQLVKDSRTLSGTKAGDAQQDMLQQVQQLCDASRAMCDSVGEPQALNTAAAKFSDASGKFMFTISPSKENSKEKQIIDLSSDACVRASELLSKVQALTQRLPAEEGEELDKRGAKTADTAQALLTTAQVTAPTIASPHCSESLVSVAEQLRSSAKDLTNLCQPHLKPGHQEQLELQQSQGQLEDSLNDLVLACKEASRRKPPPPPQSDKQRAHLMRSVSGAKSCFDDVQQQLQQPVVCALMREQDATDLQHQLSERLSQLNAAIAALTAATADRSHPDYASAQRAVDRITTLIPQLVKDSRTLSGTKAGDAQQDMLQQVQQLCDASRAMCDSVGEPQALNTAAAKFSDASGKFMFTISPSKENSKEKQIIDLSSDACVRASELLSKVQALTQRLPAEAGEELDRRGAKTADTAQALLTTAQVTAPTIASPHCSEALVSAAEQLRSSAKDLTNLCQPHLKPGHQEQLELQQSQGQLEDSLNNLVLACKEASRRKPPPPPQSDKQRAHLMRSVSGAKSCFDDVQQQLQQPVVCALMREQDATDLQHQLSERLSQLNAAIAALTAATADRSHPDYASAQKAVDKITVLLPEIVRDTRTLSATKDGKTQQDMIQQVQHLCDASRAVCESVGQSQGLSEAARKFSAASNEFICNVNPSRAALRHTRHQQIIDLSAHACGRTSHLLSQVQALTQQLDGPVASDLDSRGAHTADAAQALLSVAQVTSMSTSSPHCREVLSAAVHQLRASAGDLSSACTPHLQPGQQQQQLIDTHQQLNEDLEKLLLASGVPLSHELQEKQRQNFISSLSGIKSRFDNVQQQLQQPPGASVAQVDEQSAQRRLADTLARLNAAIAALTDATDDPVCPDYMSAERALLTISELMPSVVQDSKTLCSTKDDDTRADIQHKVSQLCDVTRGVCDSAADTTKLKESAVKLAQVSNKLTDVVAPGHRHVGDTTHDTTTVSRPPKPAVPVRAPRAVSRSSCTTQDFLNTLRTEEDNDNAARIVAAERKRSLNTQTDEHKYQLQQLTAAADAAHREVHAVQVALKKFQSTEMSCDLEPLEVIRREQRIEDSLASAGVQVARLVSANYADKLDYGAAQEPVLSLGNSVRSVVEDGMKIVGVLPQEVRDRFMSDMSALCGAATNICDAAKDHHQKLNDAAVAFGNQSARLLQIVSANVNPAVEKEVILRARGVGESASRLARDATDVANKPASMSGGKSASSPQSAQHICAAGAQCVDAARKLVYTAKLVAPTMHHGSCKETLASSADMLSTKLSTFSTSWQPLSSDPHTVKLTEESRNLEQLLEELKTDVKSIRLGRSRDERMVVVDTPLRQMTVQILENAKNMSTHGELSAQAREEYESYACRVSDALRALDIANVRSQRAPHDKFRRNELDIAIQDLQMLTLQTRPSKAGQEQNFIVDFREFLQGLSTESDSLSKAAHKHEATIGKSTADDIKLLCSKISEDSNRVMNPTQQSGAGDDSYEDVMEIYQYGQECDHLVKELNSKIRSIPDPKVRSAMYARLLPVAENCNLLRFATNSAMSTHKSASYEAALHNLDDFQTTVIKVIDTQRRQQHREREWCESRSARSESRLVRAARDEPQAIRQALASYCLTALPSSKADLSDSMSELAAGLKHYTEISCLQSANWMKPHEHGNTDPLIQEINRVRSSLKKRPEIEVLKEEDITRLLSTQSHKVDGTRNELESKLEQLSTKLSTMSGSIFASVRKPESAARSVHAAAHSATQLADVARGLKDHKKPVQCKKIEDATQEMCLATYDLLNTAQLVCSNPDHHDTRRRLLEACYHLNDSINKLNRAVHPEPKISRECNEQLRLLQLQRNVLQSAIQPAASSPYSHCIDALHSQRDLLLKLNSDQAMSREEFLKSMLFVTSAVTNSTECAAQAAYLLSVSDEHKSVCVEGVVDVAKVVRTLFSIHDTCVNIVLDPVEQVLEEKRMLEKQIEELMRELDESVEKTRDEELKTMLNKHKSDVQTSATTLFNVINKREPADVVISCAVGLDDDIGSLSKSLAHPGLVPSAGQLSHNTQTLCDDVIKHSTALVSHTQDLVKEVKSTPEHEEVFKWSSYSNRNHVLHAFELLLNTIKSSGQTVNILEADTDETEQKSYVQIQSETAFKWLHKPMVKSDVKTNGQQAVHNLIDIGNKMSEDLPDAEKEEFRHLIEETEQLLAQCSKKYDQEQYSLLMERIRELRKCIERVAVCRVVEDFVLADEPLADLDLLADVQRDSASRKFLLERKIAELLCQLGRVCSAARLVTHTAGGTLATELATCTQQTELLAPMLVKAAQERVNKPDDKAVIDNYKSMLAQYTASLCKVRDLCDQSVEPIEFVQAAGDTMHRMREDSRDDPTKGAHTSAAITKLANRVIHVSLSSRCARSDPEVQRALTEAHQQLSAATPAPDTRASKMPDWKDTTAKILNATGKVESVLGGEAIFNKEPDNNQPIYNEALNLHVSVREWSSRDNEIVAVAKRMAVLMAKLSAYMNTDKQHEVLTTSKCIVVESHEVARLAHKLAHECTDHRSKTNLLQVCERIPTVSGQLKMLTTVKGSSLGHHGTHEDKEAMDMLVGNAQTLMTSIQDVVKAAASASVKIMSQRGPRLKWVRKTYY